MELNNENYHGRETRIAYMGASQFKDFMKCEYEALKRVNGEIEEEKTDALLFGSYVDAYFSGELDDFIKKEPSLFTKSGELKAAFKNAQDVIDTIENDEMLLKYLSGEHQVIMTGTIAGVPYKIKIDSYHPGKVIVDQKIMRDLKPVWVEEDGRNVKKNFVKAYGYDIQGAIYQEVVRQNTGLKLPFLLVVTTKESVPDKALLEIDQEDLDEALRLVEALSPHYQEVKEGKIEPTKCEKCNTCRKDKKITGSFSFHTLDPGFGFGEDE